MIGRLRCFVGRHAPTLRDTVNGVPVLRCPRCWRVRVRDVADVRVVQPTDPRFRMSGREQWERRSQALRAFRGRRLRKVI